MHRATPDTLWSPHKAGAKGAYAALSKRATVGSFVCSLKTTPSRAFPSRPSTSTSSSPPRDPSSPTPPPTPYSSTHSLPSESSPSPSSPLEDVPRRFPRHVRLPPTAAPAECATPLAPHELRLQLSSVVLPSPPLPFSIRRNFEPRSPPWRTLWTYPRSQRLGVRNAKGRLAVTRPACRCAGVPLAWRAPSGRMRSEAATVFPLRRLRAAGVEPTRRRPRTAPACSPVGSCRV